VIIVIARLTIRELARRRVIWVLAALSILSVLLVGWGLERLVTLARADAVDELQIQVGVSQILILIAFMFSFVLAMTAAFVGAPAVGGDLESGIAHAILARPIRRTEVLLGRWLGCAAVVVAYTVLSGLLALGATALVSGYTPPEPVLALGFLSGQALVLLTLTMALGSILPTIAAGAIAVVGFGLGWMAGVMAGIATALGIELLGQVAELSRWLLPSDGLWRGVIYGLEPPLVLLIAAGEVPELASANPFYASAPPPLPFVVWSVVWMGLVLGLSAWRFERRDL
jgi:ABC-type transport system involved in multi-copper enzyme maturation permease subunit